jgi:hypothetical protein
MEALRHCPLIAPIHFPELNLRRADMTAHVPASVLLRDLLADAPADQVSLDWLMAKLGSRSYGIAMLLLGLLGVLPGASPFVGIVLAVPAFQMILARPGPAFPRRVALHRFRRQRLGRIFQLAAAMLRSLETFIHPRWQASFETTRRMTGTILLLLGGLLLLPVPLSNVPPSLLIVVISVAYIEADGVLLCIGLCASLLLLATTAVASWELMNAAGWVGALL